MYINIPNFKYIFNKMKNIVFRALANTAASNSILQRIAQIILKTKGFLFYPISTYETDSALLNPEISNSISSLSSAPILWPNLEKSSEFGLIYPPIMARRFTRGEIHCASTSILVNGTILLPRYHYENIPRINPSGGGVHYYGDKFCMIRRNEQEALRKGIAIIGLGSFNWYHWLIEILPTAMLSQKLHEDFSEYPFLVPSEYETFRSFRDSLEIFRFHREVVVLLPTKNYVVDDLVVIDSPVNGPFNLSKGSWPEVSDYKQNAVVLTDFRQKILDALLIQETAPVGMYFIARGNSRRDYNQNTLINIAENLGLNVIYPEELSFREQVQVFNSAKLIVGASGGAWANIIFCQPKSIGLTWIFPEYSGFCAYSNLAKMVGQNLHYIFVKGERSIKSTDSAYSMPYRVEPEVFRNTLTTLITKVDHD